MSGPTLSAETLARALGGQHPTGGNWLVRCPAHDDGTPSLAIAEGDSGAVLAKCHAGCEQAAVLAALRDRGLWGNGERLVLDPQRIEAARALRHAQEQERIEAARRTWDRARPAAGTLVETYLRARGIALDVPERVRVAVLKHGPSGRRWPCMVGLVTDHADHVLGVHRTFLACDGRGKAPVEPAKMSLGPIAGGAVRLAPAAEEILIAEGLETALAASELAGISAWAALSAGGLEALELSPDVRSVLIAADRDENGVGQRAGLAAAHRWKAEGRDVRVFLPPAPHKDFNDYLVSLRAAQVERFAS